MIEKTFSRGLKGDYVYIMKNGDVFNEDDPRYENNFLDGVVKIVTEHETSSSRKTITYYLKAYRLVSGKWEIIGVGFSTMFWRACKTDSRYEYHRSKTKLIDRIIDYVINKTT